MTSGVGMRSSPSVTQFSSRVRSIPIRRPRRIALGSKKAPGAAAAERRKHPDAKIEIWATDEHRLGLKPITRGVWAPIGERPVAVAIPSALDRKIVAPRRDARPDGKMPAVLDEHLHGNRMA